MAKLSINIQTGTIEVDGSEEFVREMYENVAIFLAAQKESPATSLLSEAPSAPRKSAQKKSPPQKEAYSIVLDLDLSGQRTKQSLKGFVTEKSPKTGMQKNVVFIHYLRTVLGITHIGVNHIYTCYKVLGEKLPAALRQNLLDTSFRKGWLDTHSLDDIKLTTHGENLVEHELP